MPYINCGTCHGKGTVRRVLDPNDSVSPVFDMNCPDCEGRGQTFFKDDDLVRLAYVITEQSKLLEQVIDLQRQQLDELGKLNMSVDRIKQMKVDGK